MAEIKKATIDALNALPLQDVMSKMNYSPVLDGKKSSSWWYRCPLPAHDDTSASFHVDLSPKEGNKYAMFNCHGCKNIHGMGAISLICQLKGWDAKADFRKACHELGRLFKLPIDGENCDGFLHRAKKIDLPDNTEYQSRVCSMTDDHINAIGCWHHRPTAEQLEQDFGIRAINMYSLLSDRGEYWRITDGVQLNSLGEPYNTYPVFEFRYETNSPYCYPLNDGGWFCRKYEPNAAYYGEPRFTWWWEGNKSRNGVLSSTIYGDIDVMNALHDGGVGVTVNPAWNTTDKRHAPQRLGRMIEIEGETNKDTKKERELLFTKIIICSGPRDAINVYYHSDAHVIWPHSESSELSPKMLQQLKDLCRELYILYDIDKTGQERALRMQLSFPELRNVVLPNDLTDFISSRTQKPCKDVADYFEQYPRRFREQNIDTRFYSIDMHFAELLSKSKHIKFWRKQKSTSLDEYGCQEENYEIKAPFMAAFLGANGYRQYKEPKTKITRIVHIKDNVVEVIPDSEVVREVQHEMTEWVQRHPAFRVNHEQLENAIANSSVVKRDKLNEIPRVELNFKRWTNDTDYLLFANGALRVNKDGWEMIPYSQLDAHVNKDAILPFSWDESNKPFMEFVYNEREILLEQARIEAQKDALDSNDNDGREQLDIAFEEFLAGHQYKINWLNGGSILDQPHVAQFVWNTGFMNWRDVNSNPLSLDNEQRQFVDAHFINKCGNIGYALAQERGDGDTDGQTLHQMMSLFNDYTCLNKSKAMGRTGKTTLVNLLRCVCKMPNAVDGSHIQTSSADFGKNFGEFTLTVHRCMPIDDIDPDFDPRQFYTACSNMPVKTLYENAYKCDAWESPKFIITGNVQFDTSSDSTRGRLYRSYFSDYYHEGRGEANKWNFIKQFGYALGSRRNEEQFQYVLTFLAQCLQFWHQTHFRVDAPLDENGRRTQCRTEVRDYMFCDWADDIFKHKEIYNYPVPYRDLIVSFFNYKRERYTRKYEREPFEITEKNIRDGISNFKAKLKIYTKWMRISIDPEEVYRQQDINNRKRIKFTTFTYAISDKGEVTRQRINDTQVHYFYQNMSNPSLDKVIVPYQTTSDVLATILE